MKIMRVFLFEASLVPVMESLSHLFFKGGLWEGQAAAP